MCEECYICRVNPVAKALSKAIRNEKWDGRHPTSHREYTPKRLSIGNDLVWYGSSALEYRFFIGGIKK